MKILAAIFSLTLLGGATIGKADACALKLPTFEVTGFPISAHQVAVLGSGDVEERAATPTLTFADMPASPHQIAVLVSQHVKKVQMADASGESVGHTDLYSKTRSAAEPPRLCISD